MNIKDIQDSTPVPEDMLSDIFAKQRQLMEKYHKIEKDNGLLICEEVPVNLHDSKGQQRLKDFFWRVTEEIAEALEALDNNDHDHFQEELADALHFLVEACILAGGLQYDKGVGPGEDTLKLMFNRYSMYPGYYGYGYIYKCAMEAIRDLGLAANCLKNKPWKQTHIATDTVRFHRCLSKAFQSFIELFKVSGFTAESLYDIYFKKNKVNQFRQRSGY